MARKPRNEQRARRWFWIAFPVTALVSVAITFIILGQMKPSLNLANLANRFGDREIAGNLLEGIEGEPAPTYEVTGDPPSEAEATETITAFLSALEAEDWAAASELTAGQARLETDEIASRFEERQSSRGISIDLRVSEPAVDSVSIGATETTVALGYGVTAYAETFLGSIQAIDHQGETTFVLVRTADGVKIADTGGFWIGEQA